MNRRLRTDAAARADADGAVREGAAKADFVLL
jgi:hypothetical protein